VTYPPNADPRHPARLKRHDRVVGIRVTDRLYQQLHADAAEAGISLAEMIRRRLEGSTTLAESAA
jgi:hypothetical protein